MSNDDTDRVTIDTSDGRGRLGRVWDTLQDTIRQPVESVTRSATLNTTGGNVEDVDPPDDIDELYDLYETIGLIRASMNKFVMDVTEPGVTAEAESDATTDYFMGGDSAPEGAPDGGFLAECFVTDEKRRPFVVGLKKAVLNRRVRGTILIEYVKANPDEQDSIISGFKHIRPETVSARTYPNTTELITPDDTEAADQITTRGEAAAYVQFDEQSILGRREDIFDNKNSIPLSQNDVLKQVYNQDIGGTDPEDGVFGTSILRAIKDDATEYRNIKRDRATAIRGKAWGLWTAQFNPEVIETDRHQEIIRWSDEDIQNAESEINNIGPGTTLTTDASVDLERHDSDVPAIEGALDHYVDDILAPLPTPKYAVGFEKDINQFVTEQQDDAYQQTVAEERDYQERQWEAAFREVARRHPELDPEGLTVTIEPEQDESPVMSLDMDTIEKIEKLSGALSDLVGQGESPAAVFGPDVIREHVARLPEDTELQETLAQNAAVDDLDETDEEVQAQFERLLADD